MGTCFFRFVTIHAFDGRTDRQTDRQTDKRTKRPCNTVCFITCCRTLFHWTAELLHPLTPLRSVSRHFSLIRHNRTVARASVLWRDINWLIDWLIDWLIGNNYGKRSHSLHSEFTGLEVEIQDGGLWRLYSPTVRRHGTYVTLDLNCPLFRYEN